MTYNIQVVYKNGLDDKNYKDINNYHITQGYLTCFRDRIIWVEPMDAIRLLTIEKTDEDTSTP